MPRLQNPTSAVMPERRRRQIAAVAEKYRLTVIEDDVYGFVSPERAPLAALIPHRTVYLTSLSKSLFPGMRLGCVAAPPETLEAITGAVWASMIMASPIGADLLSGWIEDGTAARIAEWKRHEFAARQAMARRLFDGERVQTHPSSPHLWLQLPARWSSESFAAWYVITMLPSGATRASRVRRYGRRRPSHVVTTACPSAPVSISSSGT
jgi:DNA-binding transcriptional MocR family regulator